MAKTRMSHRIFFSFLAILFFVTAFSLSFLVIWQAHQSDESQKTASQTLPSCSMTAPPASVINVAAPKGHKLAGTKLVDFTPCSISQLSKIDIEVGTGTEATSGSTVLVNYTGAVAATGVIFQSSLDSGQPAELSLSSVIPGWQEGIPGMKVGGIRRLLIPAALAYGSNPPANAGIPANANLVFDITLILVSGS
jgi:FKBP-type peptidyl-prolyl cis-trans isomerase